jgi:hypothetical protein
MMRRNYRLYQHDYPWMLVCESCGTAFVIDIDDYILYHCEDRGIPLADDRADGFYCTKCGAKLEREDFAEENL